MKKTIFQVSAALLFCVVTFNSCKKAPEANFTASSSDVQPGEPVVFSDGVSDRKNTTITYDFGDGTSSEMNERNPSHVYAKPGMYTVTQNVLSNKNANTGKGKYAVTNMDITVTGAKAKFTSSTSSPKIDGTVMFTNTTTNGDKGYALKYSWWMINSTGNKVVLSESKNAKYTFDSNDTWIVYLDIWQGTEHKTTASDTIVVGSGTSTSSSFNLIVGAWTFTSDATVTTISNSTNNNTSTSCQVDGTSTFNSNAGAVKVTIDNNGDIWVIRTTGDQVKGSNEGKIDLTSNSIAVISGGFGAWSGTYAIKNLTANSLVLESRSISNTSCTNFNGTVFYTSTPVRTITLTR